MKLQKTKKFNRRIIQGIKPLVKVQKKSPRNQRKDSPEIKKEIPKEPEVQICEPEKVKPKAPNEERFYVTNAELLAEMIKWKNSTKQGLKVQKLINNKKFGTDEPVSEENKTGHERYHEGITYIIEYTKDHPRYAKMKKKKNFQFMKEGRKNIVEDVTSTVKRLGYAFDIDDDESHRSFSNEFGTMLMKMGQKVSNHSFFRNYTRELKEDMQSYGYEKVIKGLPNYSFRFENAFAYISQAFFNSFKSILSKHYKQLNIKRALTKKAMVNLNSDMPGSSISKCLQNQFDGNDYDDFSNF